MVERYERLDPVAFGIAGAVVYAVGTLLLGIAWNLGIYVGAAEQMAAWHLVYDPSVAGILGGTIEAAIHGFVWVGLLALAYNGVVGARATRAKTKSAARV